MDTMLAHHCVYPELPKALDFLCSMYTDQPYYKDNIRSNDPEVYWRYNALDACVTKEVSEALEKELREFRTADFYFKYVHKLIGPLMEIGHRGVLVDMRYRQEMSERYKREINGLQTQLDAAVGHPLNVNSHKQVSTYLYDELKNEKQMKLRKRKGKDEKEETISTDAAALSKLMHKMGNENLGTILEIRERKKLLSTYFEAAVGDDGRMRTSYNIAGTKTGRLSSSETIFGDGLNIQNVPDGDARALFIADPGCVFVQGDLSQAEARVVAYLARDERLIRVFEEGGDIHRKNASIIFGVAEQDVSPAQRQLAKKIVHASNYGMGPRRFKDVCWEELRLEVTEAEAKRYQRMYFSQFLGIERWHLEVQCQLRRNRTLTTPYGRKRIFFGYLGDDLFREAYAHVPQSTVSDHLNHSLLELHATFRQRSLLGASLTMQVHDSLMAQCPVNKAEEVAEIMHRVMDRPIQINGLSCRIPVEFKTGNCWGRLSKLSVGAQETTVSHA
jgi:DNA polymerase-1